MESIDREYKSSTPSPPPYTDCTVQLISQEPPLLFHPVKSLQSSRRMAEEGLNSTLNTEEHRLLVSFLLEGWSQVEQEIQTEGGRVKYYLEQENPSLTGFQPFDLEAWWGQKLYQALTSGV